MFLGFRSNLKWSADLTSSDSRGPGQGTHWEAIFFSLRKERREEVKEGKGKEGEGEEEEGRGETRGGTEHRNSLFDPLTAFGCSHLQPCIRVLRCQLDLELPWKLASWYV